MTVYSTSKSLDLDRLLKQVSRSFYLSIRVLPREIRPQIGLAYLIARTTDTVADARSGPPAVRQDMLRRMRAEITAAAAGHTIHSLDSPELSESMIPIDRALL